VADGGLIVVEGLRRGFPVGRRGAACRVAGCAAGLAVLAFGVGQAEPPWIDTWACGVVARWPRRDRGVASARVLTVLGAPGVAVSLAGLALAGMSRRGGTSRRPAPVIAGVTVVVTGLMARRVLADLVQRARPPQEVWRADPHGYSFPSKHTTAGALAAIAVWRGWCSVRDHPTAHRSHGGQGQSGRGGPVSWLLPVGIAAAVGLSRLYLGVHWVTDVLAGWVFAVGWSAIPELIAGRDALPPDCPR
jgi:membrane-associated phospholipid phosphatase